MNAQQPPLPALEMPDIILEAEESYLLGFPMLMAVTFENNTEDTRFLKLPELNLLLANTPISIQMNPIDTGVALDIKPSSEERYPSITLYPGEKKRMMLDLSNFGLNIQPGTYGLTLAIHINEYSQNSNSVAVEFIAPSLGDEIEANRLRRLGEAPTDTGAWAPFLKRNWNTVEVWPELSPDASSQLAFHLFLHRAFYGEEGVEKMDLSAIKTLNGSIMSAEVLMLEFEIINARKDIILRDKFGQKILSRWPGLNHRLEQILQDNGLLTTGRKWFGAEKEFINPPLWYPYRD